ncbi:unnamed protein product, partial [Mesorhabditis spiculigera]
MDEQTPSYFVEHLATFAVGRQFGLVAPADGIRKLKQMERSSAIWAQPMVLRLRRDIVSVENDNGELVESFPLDLVEQPTAHMSSDPRDSYNNILLFVVREDTKGRKHTTPTEMHIFQCARVTATEVAEDLQHYIRGQFKKVRNGRRSGTSSTVGGGGGGGYPAAAAQGEKLQAKKSYPGPQFGDDVSVASDSSEMFERDVNTLNRCFDDIERFVARIQSAALAQRELEQQAHRYRTAQRRDKRAPAPDPHGILQMRAQLPLEAEFVEVLRKFKLSFNLLAKLRNHIHEPNAPELVHFLFSPLNVILDASHWGLGRNIAPQIVSPLLSLDARELMQNCLTSKEMDTWLSLGEAWRTPPEDWPGPLPAPYKPVFLDGFAPYGPPEPRPSRNDATIHRGVSEPPAPYRNRERTVDTAPSTPAAQRYATQQRPPQRNMSVDNLDIGRLSLEKERLEFEKEKIRERQRRLEEEEQRVREERERLKKETEMIHRERTNSTGPAYREPSVQPSPIPERRDVQPLPPSIANDPDQSPRQRAFVQDVVNRRCKLVQATYDRVAQNPKELTVSRGEYLEVLNDTKNWWECKNMHNRVGYVPHTILTVVPADGSSPQMAGEEIYVGPAVSSGPLHNGNISAGSHAGLNGYGGPPGGGGISPGQAPRAPPRYIVDAGVQANVPEMALSPIPTIPAPPPINNFEQQILHHKLRPAQERPPRLEDPKPRIQVTRRMAGEEALVQQIVSTIGQADGQKILHGAKQLKSNVKLTEATDGPGVQRWLQDKGFSMRLMELLEEQDGAALFSLSKPALERAAGKEEGARLYSQLLVEKSRSNYQTKSRAELNAILKYRKNQVDQSNEAAGEEPHENPSSSE